MKRGWVSTLAMFGLFVAWFFLLRPAVLGGSTSYIIVSGVSMLPTLRTGDLAVMWKQEDYKVGDVVAFRVDKGNVIHSIAGGNALEGYIMWGDNKNAPDPWRPTPESIVGRALFFVPGAGRWLEPLRTPGLVAGLTGMLAASVLAFAPATSGRRRDILRRRRRKEAGPSLALVGLGLAVSLSALAFGLFLLPLLLGAPVQGGTP